MRKSYYLFNQMMRNALTALLFCSLLPSGLWAAEVPAQRDAGDGFTAAFTLPQLLQAVLEKNQDILEARLKWEAAKKRPLQALSLPDPMIGLDVMGEMTETAVGPEENRVMVSQKIPFPAKIWKRWQIAREEGKAARSNYEAVRRDRLRDARKTYYALYQADASLEVIQSIHDLLQKMEGVARSRYSDGSGNQRDAAKAQAELSMTLGRVFTLEQKRAALHARLNALLNRDPLLDFGSTEKPEKPRLDETLPELLTEAARQRQELQAQEAVIHKKKHKKTLRWMNNIPDLDAGFKYTWVGSGSTDMPNDGQDSWMFPLAVNIPLWQERNISAIQEASRELEASRAKLTGMRDETFYEVRAAYLRCQTALKIVNLYDSGILPQSELALNSDKAGYEAGRTDFFALLDSERVYLNAKLGYVNIYTELLKSRADLDRSAGRDGLTKS